MKPNFKPNANRPWLLEVQDFEGLSGTVNLGNTSVLEVVDAAERGLPIPHSAAILKTLRARAKAEKLCAAAAVELRRIHPDALNWWGFQNGGIFYRDSDSSARSVTAAMVRRLAAIPAIAGSEAADDAIAAAIG